MITVVGSINLDLVAQVGRLPKPGETVPGHAFFTAAGGKGANQALAARRAGASVRMLGAVGRDTFADQALAWLEASGVDLDRVARVEAPTGVALILVDARGENAIAVVPGANGTVTPETLAGLAFAPREHVVLQQEIPLDTVELVLDEARRAGAVSLLNVAPARVEATALLAKADYVIANERELDLYADALSLDGSTREARMAAFVARTGRTLVVTLGSEGVVTATPRDTITTPAHPVVPVDTVGAGDTFCGYLAAALAAGSSLEDALARAAIAGALACLRPGAQPSIPTAAEVDAATVEGALSSRKAGGVPP